MQIVNRQSKNSSRQAVHILGLSTVYVPRRFVFLSLEASCRCCLSRLNSRAVYGVCDCASVSIHLTCEEEGGGQGGDRLNIKGGQGTN